MGRVSNTVLSKLCDFLDSLPGEVKGKCTLCNETLTHIVKQAEARTGAATATVTTEIAKRHNETAAPQDIVSGEALRNRVRQKEGDRNKSGHSDQIADSLVSNFINPAAKEIRQEKTKERQRASAKREEIILNKLNHSGLLWSGLILKTSNVVSITVILVDDRRRGEKRDLFSGGLNCL